MFRIIFILFCIIVFFYGSSKAINFDKQTGKTEQIIWGLAVLMFLILLIALVINS